MPDQPAPSIEQAPYPVLQPNLQISFYHRLETFRRSHLAEALRATVRKLDISKIDDQLGECVDPDSLAKLASLSLRGETFCPVPYVLTARPSLLGYYRLLYGLSQKEFYRNRQIALFRRLEETNELSPKAANGLDALCRSLTQTAQIMLKAIDDIDLRTIRDLQLLTLGAQLRGGQNTRLGRDAAAEVFAIIRAILHPNLIEESPQELVILNASGRKVVVAFSSDPDIAITETMSSGPRPVVSVEIKGGTDVSNIHNRIGEAEKSHQKAKSIGFHEFWTILAAEVDQQTARRESPTSSRFFRLSGLRDSNSTDYEDFRDHLKSVLGI